MDGPFEAENLSNAEQYFSLAQLAYQDINASNLIQFVGSSTLDKYKQYETAYPVFLQFEALEKTEPKKCDPYYCL